jgi:hypothetical protein
MRTVFLKSFENQSIPFCRIDLPDGKEGLVDNILQFLEKHPTLIEPILSPFVRIDGSSQDQILESLMSQSDEDVQSIFDWCLMSIQNGSEIDEQVIKPCKYLQE